MTYTLYGYAGSTMELPGDWCSWNRPVRETTTSVITPGLTVQYWTVRLIPTGGSVIVGTVVVGR